MLKNPDKELLSSTLIHRLEPLSLRAKLVVEGFLTGLHQSPYHGFSVEFAEHRMYQPGDPLKHLDWKVLGRTDRFYIKQYQEETNLRATILLDNSNSMNFASGSKISKSKYAQSLAAAFIYLFLRQRDAVGLGIFDDKIQDFYPPRSNLTWQKVLLSSLEGCEPGGNTGIGPVLHEMADLIARRGLVIIISDLLDDPEKILSGLHHFRHNGHEVLVFQILDPREMDLAYDRETRFVALEGKASLTANPWQIREDYQREMKNFLDSIHSGCAQHLVNHHLISTDTPLEEALIALLTQRMRQK